MSTISVPRPSERVCTKAYAEAFAEEFASRHLIQLGYGSVAEFRREGASELGSELYQEYIEKLAKFDLGVELAVSGYDARVPWIFDVVNPGRTLDAGILGYTVVGSGYHMAMGSLRNRPLDRGLEDLIYRLLEAKFSAETATGVGKTTTLIAVNPDGISRQMSCQAISKLSERSGRRHSSQRIPAEAFEAIKHSSVVRVVAEGDGERCSASSASPLAARTQ